MIVTMRPVIFCLSLVALSGCTAAYSSYQFLEAQRAYQEALAEGAQEKAVYEITLAHAYLQKAREEIGYSDYGAADELCSQSTAFSEKASQISREEVLPQTDVNVVPESRAPQTSKPTTSPDLDLDLDEP